MHGIAHSIQSIFPQDAFSLLAVVILMPAIGAFVNGVFGKRLGKDAVRLMALAALGTAFAASVLTFLALPHEGALTWNVWKWGELIGRGGKVIPLDVAFSVDAMTATMMLVVTGVGFLIHLYASEYMREDPSYHRFFAYLNLFCFAMLLLITGDNLAVLFVGWEGVGMCSYLLIGFWFSEEKNASAGKKAFVVNRIGDFGLLVAMALLAYYVGSLSFSEIAGNAEALLEPVKVWPLGNPPAMISDWVIFKQTVTVSAATLVGLALFLGCAGKSAQLPLYIWLPDAMAGPTPVSALIHAATMVTAGVYLVARMSAVFILSPFAMATVAVVGAATALLAASIGFFQHDLKKVLAYSTVSQLGFMFIGVGVGAPAAGFFHVFTHAFFKACLFLGAGSVIHAMHARIHDSDASQDMRYMGGLKQFMPWTRWTFLASCVSIAGVPLTAGFFSKDEILWKAFSTKIVTPVHGQDGMWQWPSWLGPAIYCVGIVGATMTAFYMFRAYFQTFHGEFRGWKIIPGWKDPHAHHATNGHDDHVDDHGHDDHADDHGHHEPYVAGTLQGPEPHESPWQMTAPLAILGAMALLAGFLNAEPFHFAPLGHRLEGIFEHMKDFVVVREGVGGESTMWMMMLPGLLAAAGGITGAWWVYNLHGGKLEREFAQTMPGLYSLIFDKWRVDELYQYIVVDTVEGLAEASKWFDTWVVDGILAKLTALMTAAVGTVLRWTQTGKIQVYSAAMTLGMLVMGWFFVAPHADVVRQDEKLRQTGNVTLVAGAGLGYTYAWQGEGITKDAADARKVSLVLKPGEHREVTLTVGGPLGGQASEVVHLERPTGRGASSDGPLSMLKGGAP